MRAMLSVKSESDTRNHDTARQVAAVSDSAGICTWRAFSGEEARFAKQNEDNEMRMVLVLANQSKATG